MPDKPYLQTILDAARRSSRSEREISREATGSHAAISQIKTGRVPSVERVRRLCEALGLEFYIGPPRKSTIKELKESLLTPEEQAKIPPEVEQALEKIIDGRYQEILHEAAEKLGGKLRRQGETAAASGQATPGLTPGGVPVEIARALNLSDDQTLQDAIIVLANIVEYVPVSDLNDFEFHIFFIKRQALQPWVTAERLMGLLASSPPLTAKESTVPEKDWVVLDPTHSQPLHDELYVTKDDDLEWNGVAIERVRKVGDKWMLFTGTPGREPRPLGGNIRLFGRVAWHGPAASRDIRDEFGYIRKLASPILSEWRTRPDAG